MQWLATAVDDLGVPAVAVRPQEVVFTEEHLQVPYAGGLRPVSVVYRFFELFDLPNIPKYELILYAAKKGRVAITPPLKSYLEEKLLFALFHHPVLAHFWREQLGAEVQRRLEQVIPETWVLDPAPLPPAATIPGLRIADRPVQSWDQLRGLTQKWRQLVVKPSGFDELAWGSRGVSVGHDMAAEDWEAAVDTALARFPRTRYVLQHFYRTERSPRTLLRLCPQSTAAAARPRTTQPLLPGRRRSSTPRRSAGDGLSAGQEGHSRHGGCRDGAWRGGKVVRGRYCTYPPAPALMKVANLIR